MTKPRIGGRLGSTTTEAIPITELAPAILAELSRCVMTIGPLIDQAMNEIDDFDSWVHVELPLQPRTAERIRAMWLIHTEHPSDDLPEPWKALWSLG